MTPFECIETLIIEDEGGWVFTDRADDAGGPTYGGMTWRTFDAWQQKKVAKQDQYMEGEFVAIASHRPQTDAVAAALRNRIRACYSDEFWIKGHVDEVPEFAQQMYFSACVNMALKEALKCLQLAFNNQTEISTDLSITVDGRWGPQTAGAMVWFVEKAKEFEQYQYIAQDNFKLAFSDAVMQRYIRIVQRNAREWRECAVNARNLVFRGPTTGPVPRLPNVLQSENLMGWFNRAKSYRIK